MEASYFTFFLALLRRQVNKKLWQNSLSFFPARVRKQ